jgi:hypothetical protein
LQHPLSLLGRRKQFSRQGYEHVNSPPIITTRARGGVKRRAAVAAEVGGHSLVGESRQPPAAVLCERSCGFG